MEGVSPSVFFSANKHTRAKKIARRTREKPTTKKIGRSRERRRRWKGELSPRRWFLESFAGCSVGTKGENDHLLSKLFGSFSSVEGDVFPFSTSGQVPVKLHEKKLPYLRSLTTQRARWDSHSQVHSV